VIVTSIEFEHPEFFADYEAFLAAFEHFIRGMDTQGAWSLPPTLIVNADSPGCLDLLARLNSWSGRIVTYSVAGLKSIRQPVHRSSIAFEAYDVKLAGETSFRVRVSGFEAEGGFTPEQVIHLQLPGLYNIQNALAALTAAHLVGVDATTIAKTLEGFGGTRRRFEIRHHAPLTVNDKTLDIVLVDDYAHHPTAIAATLEAAHQRYPDRRLVAVYQPHMYSRTKTFFEQFVYAFDNADIAIIADIFPAREIDTGLVHARDLVEEMAQRAHFSRGEAQVLHGGNIQDTINLLTSTLRSGDVVLIMGAGDIYTVTEALLRNAGLA
jgi:UDP-N-acetylmuramate--alanine ligase